jgi:hypothetical protein
VPASERGLFGRSYEGFQPPLAHLVATPVYELSDDPALMVAPWVAFNLHHYGAPTGSGAVQKLMDPVLNPEGRDYGLGDLGARHVALLNAVLPDEWWVEFLSAAKRRLRDLFALLVLALPVLAAVRIPPAERRTALAVLVLPLVAGVLLMSVSLLVENYDAFYGRYLYGMLPGFALFGALALRRAFGERALAWASAGITVTLLALWAHLATVTPATV